MSIDVTASGTGLSVRVAEEIKIAMLRRKVTGAKLAQELGVSAAWISYRLTGNQEIGLNDLQRIAGVLRVKAADLIANAERGDGAYVSVGSRPPDVTVSGTTPWPSHPIVAGMVPLQRQPPGLVPAQRKTYPTGR